VSEPLGPAVPILRIFDVAAAKRFYLDYLGCALDWEDGEGEGDRPVYMQVSRGPLVLHLSSHPDDGTPAGRSS
jgi:catechol 2,3-dioxygenase-like lactoylglutathione lyase family enzyme